MSAANLLATPRRGGREAEGGGLLNRCRGQNLYRGFESPPLRQISLSPSGTRTYACLVGANWLMAEGSAGGRNPTALAISSGVPSLPSGTLLEIAFKRCSPAPVEATRSFSPGVSMGPGLTAFTRMWRSFKSVVHVRANERTAAFVAL